MKAEIGVNVQSSDIHLFSGLNTYMALSANNGTEYYAISCGVPSTTTNLTANNFTGYYHLSANDFILWGQDTAYPTVTANNGTTYYFLQCNVPSSLTLNVSLLSATASLSALPISATEAQVQENLIKNNGTAYLYSSAFNCVDFCDEVFYYSPSGLEWNG